MLPKVARSLPFHPRMDGLAIPSRSLLHRSVSECAPSQTLSESQYERGLGKYPKTSASQWRLALAPSLLIYNNAGGAGRFSGIMDPGIRLGVPKHCEGHLR
jgi:hypothetical protein